MGGCAAGGCLPAFSARHEAAAKRTALGQREGAWLDTAQWFAGKQSSESWAQWKRSWREGSLGITSLATLPNQLRKQVPSGPGSQAAGVMSSPRAKFTPTGRAPARLALPPSLLKGTGSWAVTAPQPYWGRDSPFSCPEEQHVHTHPCTHTPQRAAGAPLLHTTSTCVCHRGHSMHAHVHTGVSQRSAHAHIHTCHMCTHR